MIRLQRARPAVAAGGALVVAAALALAVPASGSAHAKLVRTVPVAGAVLQRQPQSVAFYFNEPVEANFGVIRVFDADGAEVQAGAPFRPQGESNALEVALQPNLPDGTYSATYRIISADSYPVSGGVVFSIGAPSSGASPQLAGSGGVGTSHRRRSLGRSLARLRRDRARRRSAVLPRLGVAPALAGRSGGDEERWVQASAAFNRRFGLLLGVAVVAGLVTSLLALPLQAASAAGTSLWDGLDRDVLGEVVHTRFGSLMLVRAAAWALLGGILVLALRRSRLPSYGTSLRPVPS